MKTIFSVTLPVELKKKLEQKSKQSKPKKSQGRIIEEALEKLFEKEENKKK